MVLVGLNPDDCMEAARSGLHFWEMQQELQLNCQESATQSARHQIADLQNEFEDKFSEMSREIASLKEECHSKFLNLVMS